MNKLASIFFAFVAAIATPASAALETFDSAASASTHGFTLSSNIYFHDSGRPYLEMYDQSHSIIASTPFTFNSLDFNYDPWAGYNGGSGSQLQMILLDASNAVLLDTLISIPTNRQWITYSNTIANVSTIYFSATNGFWPSFDNLVYDAQVPEPESLVLLACGLIGMAAARRRVA